MCDWKPPEDAPDELKNWNCDWKPPEDASNELKNWKCEHASIAGRDDKLCIFHIPLEEKNNNPSLAEDFRGEFIKLFKEGRCDFVGFKFPDNFSFGEEKDGKYFPLDFREKTLLINQNKREDDKEEKCRFDYAEFGIETNFRRSKLNDGTSFEHAVFGSGTSFSEAQFGNNISFQEAIFEGELYFRKVSGRELAFNSTSKKQTGNDIVTVETVTFQATIPEIIFKKTIFRGPAHFYRCDLSKTIFQQVDLSGISFLQSNIKATKFISCKWGAGTEAHRFWLRKQRAWFRFTRTRLFYDELIWRKSQDSKQNIEALQKFTYDDYNPNKECEAIERQGLKYYKDLSPGDIEALALQLKQSLEATKDPIAAGDFHFCFMDMKREQAKEDGRKGRAFALWLYKMANGYGERYGRTLMWLGWLVAIFTGIYAWNGHFAPAEWTCREVAAALDKGQAGPAASGFWEYLLFAFQNILPFKFGQPILHPCSIGAKALSFAETFIGSSLFAFFLLALRRRFKR